MTELLGSDAWYDHAEFLTLASRLVLDLLVVTLIVHGVYFRKYRQSEYVFTYYLFNLVTFVLTLLLRRVEIELGFALGLFAVFGVLRYRTEPIRIRDLTYMFLVIGIALVNALADHMVSVAELLFVDWVLVAATVLLEHSAVTGKERARPVLYDRLDLLGAADRAELLADLRARTRLPVSRVRIDRVDLLRDTAELTVYFQPEDAPYPDGR